MSGEEWRGAGSRFGISSIGVSTSTSNISRSVSGGSKRWSWWGVGTSSGGVRRGWGSFKEKGKGSPKESRSPRLKDSATATENWSPRRKDAHPDGHGHGMSSKRAAGVWAAFLIVALSLVMIVNNAKLIRVHTGPDLTVKMVAEMVNLVPEVPKVTPLTPKLAPLMPNPVPVVAKAVPFKDLPPAAMAVLDPHPCEAFRVPPPPKDPKRTGPRPCPVCYLPEELAISQIPLAGKFVSPVLKRLRFVSDERASRRPSPKAPGSAFGGYPSLQDRAKSYEVREDMEVHCGFVKGPTPGMGTGYDFDDDDRTAMHACRGVVVASAIFGNYDQLQQPKNMSLEAKKSVCFFMFVDVETEAYLDDYDVNFKTTKQVGLWRVVVVRNLPYRDARRTGKIPKLLLHRLFPFVRYSIWVDGKLELVQDPYRILERFLWRTNETFAISQHYKRFDVFLEAEANKAAGKYSNNSIDMQVEFYKQEGLVPYSSAKLPITSDVPEGCVIIREHTPIANLMSCLWFNEVDRFTSRDQISFGIVRDKIMASVKDFRVSMFRDCERRNFVVQGYHRDLLVKRGILPSSNSSRVVDVEEVNSEAVVSSSSSSSSSDKLKNQAPSKRVNSGPKSRKIGGRSRFGALH